MPKQLTFNHGVVGSIPTALTKQIEDSSHEATSIQTLGQKRAPRSEGISALPLFCLFVRDLKAAARDRRAVKKVMMTTSACSFCGKGKNEVMVLVAGPKASICDECAMLAVEMIGVEHPDWRERLIRTLALLPKRSGETS